MSAPDRIESLALGRRSIGAGPAAALDATTLLTLLAPGREPRPPMLVNRDDESLAPLSVHQEVRPTAIALLEDVTIRPGHSLATKGAYVLESLNDAILDATQDLRGERLPLSAMHARYREAEARPPRPLPDGDRPYAWVSTFWSGNFGHWHIETLSALDLLEMAGVAATPLLPPMVDWQRDSLRHAGWPPGRYVELPDHAPLQARRLIFPSPAWLFQGGGTLNLFGIAPQLCGWVQRIGASVAATARDPDALPLPRRIYLTRRIGGAINRPLDNEAELEALFAARGYTALSPDTLSYEDEVRLFAGAERIAGPSGAALTLLPFAPAGVHVVQLSHPAGHYYPWHAWLSCFTPMRHFAYHERPDRITMREGPQFLDIERWSIDVPRLARVLERVDAHWG